MAYSIEFDRTGYPLVCKPYWPNPISLFPISKVQFERFMIEQGPVQPAATEREASRTIYTDAWYREHLEVNSRGNARDRFWSISSNEPHPRLAELCAMARLTGSIINP